MYSFVLISGEICLLKLASPLNVVTACQLSKVKRSFHVRWTVFLQWHLGFFEKEYTPTYRGFESFYGFWNGKEDYWDHSSLEDVWGRDLRNNMTVNTARLH